MSTRPRTGMVSVGLTENGTSGWRKVASENICRICELRGGLTGERLTRHHIVPQAWFLKQPPALRALRNANANIVPLCPGCHRCVDGRDISGRREYRVRLRERMGTAELAFVIQVRGVSWLDHHYPRRIIEPVDAGD